MDTLCIRGGASERGREIWLKHEAAETRVTIFGNKDGHSFTRSIGEREGREREREREREKRERERVSERKREERERERGERERKRRLKPPCFTTESGSCGALWGSRKQNRCSVGQRACPGFREMCLNLLSMADWLSFGRLF